jgi:hypothetical protein
MVEEIKAPREACEPQYIYSYKSNTDELYRTSLETGEDTVFHIPDYTFPLSNYDPVLVEVPGDMLFVFGGDVPDTPPERTFLQKARAIFSSPEVPSSREYVASCINLTTLRVTHLPHMTLPAGPAIYHNGCIYTACYLGGQRFIISENRWEAALGGFEGRSCFSLTKVGQYVYFLGGQVTEVDWSNALTRVNLVTMAIDNLETLPINDSRIQTFTISSRPNEFFFFAGTIVHAYNSLDGTYRQVGITSSSLYGCQPGYYCNGIAYGPSSEGAARRTPVTLDL